MAWSRRKTTPVKNTCPDINQLISTITSIVKQMENCDSEDSLEGLLTNIRDWSGDLKNIGVGYRCELEDLRASNSALREWGTEMYDDAEKLEEELDEANSKIVELESEIKYLEKNIDTLERNQE